MIQATLASSQENGVTEQRDYCAAWKGRERIKDNHGKEGKE